MLVGDASRSGWLLNNIRQELHQVKDRATEAGLELLGAGHARDDQRARAVAVGLADLCEQILADGHAKLIELFFVTETAGHAAAFDLGGGDVESGGAEQVVDGVAAADGL